MRLRTLLKKIQCRIGGERSSNREIKDIINRTPPKALKSWVNKAKRIYNIED